MVLRRSYAPPTEAPRGICFFCDRKMPGMTAIVMDEAVSESVCDICPREVRPHKISAHFPNCKFVCCPDCSKPEAQRDRVILFHAWAQDELTARLMGINLHKEIGACTMDDLK
jgi:hypothetical protein